MSTTRGCSTTKTRSRKAIEDALGDDPRVPGFGWALTAALADLGKRGDLQTANRPRPPTQDRFRRQTLAHALDSGNRKPQLIQAAA